ncbi:MAG TPA: alcohol acetyltransferase [Arachnia sp.]|nr:alcohol acetyltransferase [Arachnia sp.]HMT85169.1 alcohol acetyltransferase [Arachnia sp.]
MTRRAWVRLDNASNVFLAALSDADPKVFRMSAEMDRDVDPVLLQEALDATYDRYRLYHAVLRRGIFWYYLQDSDLRPLVAPDTQHTCAPLYHADRAALLFRVAYHRRRIVLEVFHALSDGTGALWFLTDLITEYVQRYPQQQPPPGSSPEDDAPAPIEAAPAEPAPDDATPHAHELTADSFVHYFHRRRREDRRPPAESRSAFSGAAAPAAFSVEDAVRDVTVPTPVPGREPRPPRRKIYRVTGTRTPDNRPRLVELTMPAKDVLALARAEGVALTSYLIAMFFESVRLSSSGLGRRRTLTASVPVNLRQFFPSTSARNFFATFRAEHTYGEGADDFGSICRGINDQFTAKVTPEALAKKLRRFIRLERMPVLRILPQPLKDLVLGLGNRANNRGLSIAVSNLGLVQLPEPAETAVRRLLFHVSAVRPQFGAISHAGLLTISFTSPFVETGHVREFARMLTAQGIDVTVAAARVTEEELAEAEEEGS